jgi:hypothetical protein
MAITEMVYTRAVLFAGRLVPGEFCILICSWRPWLPFAFCLLPFSLFPFVSCLVFLPLVSYILFLVTLSSVTPSLVAEVSASDSRAYSPLKIPTRSCIPTKPPLSISSQWI